MLQNKRKATGLTRIMTGVMLTLFLSSMVLPVGQNRAVLTRGYELFLLGGVLQLGLHMLPANIFFLLGVQAMFEESPKVSLICGFLSLAFGLLGAQPVAESTGLYYYPAYWIWMLSFALLFAVSGKKYVEYRQKKHRTTAGKGPFRVK